MAQVIVSPILVEIRHLAIRASFEETIDAHEKLSEMFYRGHGFGNISAYAMLSNDALRDMAGRAPILPYSQGLCKAIRDEYFKAKMLEWTRKAS